jgi:uroporphyrinogen decarboxylase
MPLNALKSRPRPGAAATTSEALFLRACRGLPVERTPAWIMRQAGRYLPEYRALRDRFDFLTLCQTPELACELTLQPLRRYPLDAAIVFSDILVPLPGMGIDVAFEPAPRLSRVLRRRADVTALRSPDASEASPFVGDAVRLLKRDLRVPLIAFAGAPFTLAAYLVEGSGSRSFEHVKALLSSEPDTAELLLSKCADAAGSSLRHQLACGADAVMLFDSWAGALSPADVRRFALPFARRAFEAATAGRHGAGAPPRIYYAGEAAGWLQECRGLGADVVGVDWRIELLEAREKLGPEIAVQGNLDPCALLAPAAEIRRRARALLGSLDALDGHVFNLGHGILPTTPTDAVSVLLDAVREASERNLP